MRSASYQSSSYAPDRSLRSRAPALALSILVTALIVYMLIRLGMLSAIAPKQPPLVMIQLPPGPGEQPTKTKSVEKAKHTSGGAHPTPVHKEQPAPSPTTPPPTPPTPAWNVIYMSRQQMAAADISNLPSHSAERAAANDSGDGAGHGHDSGDDDGSTAGPGGERLYNAEWYSKPTHAQLATYLPTHGPDEGWGDIACRTAPQYHVEDCRELGETPGSGFSRALREAAWQFLVRPPRVGGKPQIGTWVRIHFDFSRTAPAE